MDQLEEEFFRQGDVERAAGMTVSPLFDRSKQGITKSQVGFFDIVIIPLFHTFSKVFGNCKPLLTYVMRNYRYWWVLCGFWQALVGSKLATCSAWLLAICNTVLLSICINAR